MRQLTATLLALLVLAACDVDPSVQTGSDVCEPFPIAEAQELIDSGTVLEAAAVRDPHQTPQGSDLWVIAINVDGEPIILAHNVPSGDPPTGPGLWQALDSVSSQVSGFPLNSESPNPWPISTRSAGFDCVR